MNMHSDAFHMPPILEAATIGNADGPAHLAAASLWTSPDLPNAVAGQLPACVNPSAADGAH